MYWVALGRDAPGIRGICRRQWEGTCSVLRWLSFRDSIVQAFRFATTTIEAYSVLPSVHHLCNDWCCTMLF